MSFACGADVLVAGITVQVVASGNNGPRFIEVVVSHAAAHFHLILPQSQILDSPRSRAHSCSVLSAGQPVADLRCDCLEILSTGRAMLT